MGHIHVDEASLLLSQKLSNEFPAVILGHAHAANVVEVRKCACGQWTKQRSKVSNYLYT